VLAYVELDELRAMRDNTGQFLVESPMPGTPAYEAGVMAGDLILKVDGKSLENWNLKKVIESQHGGTATFLQSLAR
jgi:carboxyl-terminal processing protease